MTKGSSPLAKLRDLKRLLKKKESTLTPEQKDDIGKRIAEAEKDAAKPRDSAKVSSGKGKKESKRRSGADKLKSEAFKLREKLFKLKKDKADCSEADIESMTKELAAKQAKIEEHERSRRQEQEKEWQAARKKRRQKAPPAEEAADGESAEIHDDTGETTSDVEAVAPGKRSKTNDETAASKSGTEGRVSSPEEGEIDGPSVSSFFEIVTEGGEVDPELEKKSPPHVARAEKRDRDKRSLNGLQRRRYFDAAAPPVSVPADGPLNRRQRRALARGDAKVEETSTWEDRRDPTTSVAFDPTIKSKKKIFDLSD